MGLRDHLDHWQEAQDKGTHFVVFYLRGEIESEKLLEPHLYVEAYDDWHDATGLGKARHNYPRKRRIT